MNGAEIMHFFTLMDRSGLPANWSRQVFHRGSAKYSILELFRDGVKGCCFLNRPDVLRELTTCVKTHKCGADEASLLGVRISLQNNSPLDIVLRLVGELFPRGMLSLLPSFVQIVVDVCKSDLEISNNFDALNQFMRYQVSLLSSDNEQLNTDGYEALFEVTRILLNVLHEIIVHTEDVCTRYMRTQASSTALLALFQSRRWTLRNVHSVESVEKHFRAIVRIVELFIKHRVSDDTRYTFAILSSAAKQIEIYETMIAQAFEDNTDGLLLAKMNAILDGFGDVLRCFLLERSHASSIRLHLGEARSQQQVYDITSVIVTIIGYSSETGRSRKLIQLLFDAMSCAELNKLKEKLESQVQDTPATSENNFHSAEIKALECLMEVELPRRLQYLSRQALHRALWDRQLHHASWIALGLPERLISYCMYL